MSGPDMRPVRVRMAGVYADMSGRLGFLWITFKD